MPATRSAVTDFLGLLTRSGLFSPNDLKSRLEQLRSQGRLPAAAPALAQVLVEEGMLTPFQAGQLLAGKSKGFKLGSKYKLLDRLGTGGMAAVFLCEHVIMHRLVALKVLPPEQAESQAALDRFHREARAAAQLNHPNIVRAHDVDHDGKLHFLVMEFVDGNTLEQIVRQGGPLSLERACHYIRQAALGLQHAHESGLVHRDIKPANLLLNRDGVVLVLDMGLARFFHDSEDNLTRDLGAQSVLGTAAYMAPEQAIDSTGVDIRADLYSLGGTFYFLLTGESPFAGASNAQKLLMHQMKPATRIRTIRPEIPQEIDDLIAKLLEKDPAQRLQQPIELAEALLPWTQTPIAPPDEAEMPAWPPAVRALMRGDAPRVGSDDSSSGRSGVLAPLASRIVAAGHPSRSGINQREVGTAVGCSPETLTEEAALGADIQTASAIRTPKRPAPARSPRRSEGEAFPVPPLQEKLKLAPLAAPAAQIKPRSLRLSMAKVALWSILGVVGVALTIALALSMTTPAKKSEPVVQLPRYVPLPLNGFATCPSDRGMFTNKSKGNERLLFPQWGRQTFEDVPFEVIDPCDGTRNNVIVLQSDQGALAKQMPRSVFLPCEARARAIHLLGGVASWGFPAGNKGETSMLVRLRYSDRQTEDFALLNGVHIADYNKPGQNVPQSKRVYQLGGRQLRYLQIQPSRSQQIDTIEFLKGSDQTAPIVAAVTIELAD